MNLEENSITTDYFFDTYALYELIKENKNYKRYLNTGIVISQLNLFELYFIFLKEGKQDLAEIFFTKYASFVEHFDEIVIKNAALLKLKLNKRDVSMTDCIGYCFAQQLGIPFLTGDSAFEHMAHVAFVK